MRVCPRKSIVQLTTEVSTLKLATRMFTRTFLIEGGEIDKHSIFFYGKREIDDSTEKGCACHDRVDFSIERNIWVYTGK